MYKICAHNSKYTVHKDTPFLAEKQTKVSARCDENELPQTESTRGIPSVRLEAVKYLVNNISFCFRNVLGVSSDFSIYF